MKRQSNFAVIGIMVLALIASSQVKAQEEPIIEIPLDLIPDGTLLQGAGGITLAGDVMVNQNLAVAGMVDSVTGGYKFPDETIQVTAASTVEGSSANGGLYDNRIKDMIPPQPFSEICFKQGQAFGDIHIVSESTSGGNCVPGDLGFIIERNQRAGANWEDARFQCLLGNMRLPEAFEWLYSCNNAATFGLNTMTGDWEWASNSTLPMSGSMAGLSASAAGLSTCNSGTWGWVASGNSSASSFTYRCIR